MGKVPSWGCLSTQDTVFCMRPSTINRKITMHSYCRFILNNTRTTSGWDSDVHITKMDIIHITNIQIIKPIKHSLAHKNEQIKQHIKRGNKRTSCIYTIHTYRSTLIRQRLKMPKKDINSNT